MIQEDAPATASVRQSADRWVSRPNAASRAARARSRSPSASRRGRARWWTSRCGSIACSQRAVYARREHHGCADRVPLHAGRRPDRCASSYAARVRDDLLDGRCRLTGLGQAPATSPRPDRRRCSRASIARLSQSYAARIPSCAHSHVARRPVGVCDHSGGKRRGHARPERRVRTRRSRAARRGRREVEDRAVRLGVQAGSARPGHRVLVEAPAVDGRARRHLAPQARGRDAQRRSAVTGCGPGSGR